MITIDFGDIASILTQSEIEEAVADKIQDMSNGIFIDLTSSPPIGTPVDKGGARNGWQQDLSDPLAPEIYNTVPYIGRLNRGHSKQSPAGFVDVVVDKWTQ